MGTGDSGSGRTKNIFDGTNLQQSQKCENYYIVLAYVRQLRGGLPMCVENFAFIGQLHALSVSKITSETQNDFFNKQQYLLEKEKTNHRAVICP